MHPSNSHNNGLVKVKEFGAVGDGKTDDTLAIDNAISFAFRNRRTLDFENGNYIYARETPLFMNGFYNDKFIHWKGNGARIIFTKLDISYFSFYRMEYINIEGLDFEGPGNVGDSPNQNAFGIGIYSTKRAHILNCSFTKFVGDGLLISSEQSKDSRNYASQNVVVQNCYFNNNGRGGLTVVGCVSGNIISNHFDSAKLTTAPVIGDSLHIESDFSKRYGVEGLNISNNLIYSTVNLTNSSWREGWIGEKDTWINFYKNKVIAQNSKYAIISSGGNIKIKSNEIENTSLNDIDNVGIGTLFLKCNSAIIERNTIKTTGKSTIISIYNWTHDNKGKILLKENIYNTNSCSYVYRFYKDPTPSFTNYHHTVKIINENYLGIRLGNWLLSAPQLGGSTLKYYLKGLRWTHPNGIEFRDTTSKHIIYVRNSVIGASSFLLKWNMGGEKPIFYNDKSELSGQLTEQIQPLPININVIYKINKDGNGYHDPAYNSTLNGRVNTLNKVGVGTYQWNAFLEQELYKYTLAISIILPFEEQGYYSIAFKRSANFNKLLVEVRNEKKELVDLPLGTGVFIQGNLIDPNQISDLYI